jgi:subtilase family serine protease
MSAAVNGGVLTYMSFPTTSSGAPEPIYMTFGGTSVASPLFAGVVALADQIAGHPLGLINPRMYLLEHAPPPLSGIVDITNGNNTFEQFNEEGAVVHEIPGYNAVRGYDMASGLGTVDALPFAHALGGR